MYTILLVLLAIAPPVALMVLIYWMDRHEPEALKNIMLAMFIGSMSIIPAVIIEVTFESVPIFSLPGYVGGFYESFFLVAPSEELAKFFFIYLFVRKKSFYNQMNDGLEKNPDPTIGFALLENLFYVFDNGFSTGVLRAFTSIPIHTFCGIIVGYHMGLVKFTHQLKPKRLMFRGLFLAYLTHAFFNTFASSDNLLVLLLLPLVIATYFIGYKVLKRGRQFSIKAQVEQEDMNTYTEMTPISSEPTIAHAGTVTNYPSKDVVIGSDGRKHLVPKKEKWKAVISRMLLIATGLLWLLVFYDDDTPSAELWELIGGMILLTIIPFMIGLLLELSYQRRKRRKIYIDK